MSARRAPYGVREFDLSTARDNRKVTIKADNFAILSAEDSATIRVNSPDASAIPVREISGLTIAGEEGDPGIERIYLSNSSGTGKLRLLTGFGVASGDTSTPTDDTTDVSNRSARELGKARLETKDGTLVSSSNPLPVNGNSSLSEPLDVSDATVTVTDDGNLNISGTVTIQEGSPLDVSAATVTTDFTAREPITVIDSGTGAANAAQLDLGTEGGRVPVDIAYDTTGSADLTVEVSSDGSNWHELEGTPAPSSAVNLVYQTDTAFRYVRAYLDQNRTEVEISAKGV
jgi:hypothetical protein